MMQEILTALQENQLFKDWKKENSFLSHFFNQVSFDLKLKGSWEVGYFNKDSQKMTIFVQNGADFSIKPEDEVFKKPGDVIEELNLDNVKITFEDALKVFKENVVKLFPNEKLGDGFVVLQQLQGKVLWNFTFVSKSIKFLNVKIDAVTSKVADHQAVELIQK
jgi:hypothetical protein